MAAILVAAGVCLTLLLPGDVLWINDEPALILLAMEANRAGVPASAGLPGTVGICYGPLAVWFYQLLLFCTAHPVLLVTIKSTLVMLASLAAIQRLGKELRFDWRLFGMLFLLNPFLWHASRILWDNVLLLPLVCWLFALLPAYWRRGSPITLAGIVALMGAMFWLHPMSAPLIGAFGITLGERSRIRPQLERAQSAFAAEFGAVRLTDEAIVPTRNPEQSRSLPLPANGLVLYAPDLTSGITLGEADAQLLNYLLVWSPRMLLTGVRSPGGDWQIWSKQTEPEGGNLLLSYDSSRFVLTGATALPEYLRSLRTPKGGWGVPVSEEFPAEALFGTVGMLLYLSLFFGYTAMLMVTALLCTGVFTLVFRFASMRQLRVLTIRELWKTGLYAGFPAMIIGSFFPALNLPLFSFSTIYMFGLVIYWILIISRIERSGQEEEKKHE